MTASSPGFAFRPADGGRVRVSAAVALFGEHGDMTYTIQGPQSGGWKSELAWPIRRTAYAGGVVSATIADRLQLNIGGWKNLNARSGAMQDRDWFDDYGDLFLALYGDDTAIYGEFDATLEALKLDGNLRVDVVRQSALAVGILVGYAYTRFAWTTGDGFQESHIAAYDIGPISGPGITYEQRLRAPYLGLAASLRSQTIPAAADLHLRYSPIARCEDVDDHLARQKESIGVTRGAFVSFGSDLHVRLHPSWVLTGTLNYERYDLAGTQDQVFYGGLNAGLRYSGIDMTVTGSQLALGILIRYDF